MKIDGSDSESELEKFCRMQEATYRMRIMITNRYLIDAISIFDIAQMQYRTVIMSSIA